MAAALVGLTDLEGRGVALVGPVSGGLPRFELPGLDGAAALLPAAAGIALMSFIESISAARAFAAKTDPPVDADRRPPPRVVLLDLSAVNDLDVTALDRLGDLAEDLHGQGMVLWAASPSRRPLEMLGRAAELLGRPSMQDASGRLGVRAFLSLDDAVGAYQDQREAGPHKGPA